MFKRKLADLGVAYEEFCEYQKLNLKERFFPSGRYFIFGSELFDCLKEVHNDVSPEHLKPANTFPILVQFPRPIAGGGSNLGRALVHGFVFLYDSDTEELCFDLILSFLNQKSERWTHSQLRLKVADEKTVDQVCENNARLEGMEWANFRQVRSGLNHYATLVLYILSGDPDVRHLKAAKDRSSRNKQEKRYGVHFGHDATLVGFNFKKPIVYSKEKTVVRMHARWQPYKPEGPGTAWKLKLIWIEPHERRLKKE